MSTHDANAQTEIKDTGYTLICQRCCRRHGDMKEAINTQRDIRFSVCATCAKKSKPVDDFPALPNERVAVMK